MTGIEWTDKTWNPVAGCDRVSPGCDNCYALTMAKRLKAMGSPGYDNDGDPRTSGPGFKVTLHPNRLTDPLRWRKPRRVFVDSMGDLFHTDVPDEFIARVFAVMALTSRHTYQLLTKRHARMRTLLSSADFREALAEHTTDLIASTPSSLRRRLQIGPVAAFGGAWTVTSSPDTGNLWSPPWPLPNVHLGVSVEDQHWADIRIPALLDTPAAVRWISAEPLLGPVDLQPWLSPFTTDHPLDWIVCGGESGKGARPMHPQWARGLRDQCATAGVPFLFKQWGAWRHCAEAADLALEQAMRAAGTYQQWERYPTYDVALDGTADLDRIPELGVSAPMQLVGKKVAGRELDGRTHDDYPAVAR